MRNFCCRRIGDDDATAAIARAFGILGGLGALPVAGQPVVALAVHGALDAQPGRIALVVIDAEEIGHHAQHAVFFAVAFAVG